MHALYNIRTIVILAFALRLIWLLFVDTHPVSDPSVYDEFARSIVEGRGFAYKDGSLTAFWPVGTSAIYALIYSIFGYEYIFIAIFNLLIGTGIIYLGWSVTQHFFDQKTALITACILALWPLLIQFTTILASELLFIFLMLLAISIFIKENLRPTTQAIAFGLTIGLACYIRPIIFPLLIILPTLKLIADRDLTGFFKQLIPSLLVVIIIVSPWSYRNTQLYGELTLLSTNFGPNLWMGNNPDSNGGYMQMPNATYDSEKDRAKQLKDEAINFIVENPDQYAVLALKRLAITFSRETIGVAWNRVSLNQSISDKGIALLKMGSTIYWYFALILGIGGLLLYLFIQKWSAVLFPPLVIAGYLASIPLLTVGQDRYHMPLIPFIACFSAYALQLAHKQWRNRQPL
jgi:4-amino-4-deoxy-L-arabinose transferase-like glycosyltransferase